MQLAEAWALAPNVAMRPEPFGALAYHFENRRLIFLKTPGLVTVVNRLGDVADVRTALVEAGVADEQWPSYLAALQSLAAARMLEQREAA